MLERWTRRSTVSAGLALRARVVLAAAGATNVEVDGALGCSTATVAEWRRRFASGLVGLSDEYRSGRPGPSATTSSNR